MIAQKDYGKIESELQSYLSARFDDVSVRVGDGIHYKGTNIVITSSRFAEWLPEQRYHHVVREIPLDFYNRHLREGIVWFELAPGESAQEYMRRPRSEDVAKEVAKITDLLLRVNFAERLNKTLGDRPDDASPDDFLETRKTLLAAGLDADQVQKVCLLFIHRGAFCDAHVVTDVLPRLKTKRTV